MKTLKDLQNTINTYEDLDNTIEQYIDEHNLLVAFSINKITEETTYVINNIAIKEKNIENKIDEDIFEIDIEIDLHNDEHILEYVTIIIEVKNFLKALNN